MTKVLNVKDNNSSFEYALHLLQEAIVDCKITEDDIIIVIHGYGSGGKGGVIKSTLHEYLHTAKRQRVIVDYFPGEKFSHSSDRVSDCIKLYPELLVNNQINSYNSGVTVVWVQNSKK